MAKTTFFKDFKAFITKGNVIDMAVGVVIGGSFGKIVTGLVNYIINPFVGIFLKSGSLDSIKTVIVEGVEAKDAVLNEAGEIITPAVEAVQEVAILWGTWFQTIIDFFITALCIFIVLRIIMGVKNKLEAKKMAEEAEKAAIAKAEADKAAAEAAESIAADLLIQRLGGIHHQHQIETKGLVGLIVLLLIAQVHTAVGEGVVFAGGDDFFHIFRCINIIRFYFLFTIRCTGSGFPHHHH